MKKAFELALILIALTISVSCTKDDTFEGVKSIQIETVQTVPSISCMQAEPTGIVVVDAASDGSLNTTWNSNVEFITGWTDELNHNSPTTFSGGSDIRVGTSNIPFSWNAVDYTIDCQYLLSQNVFNAADKGVFYVYSNYGPVQTIANFRLRGSKTRYMDFDADKWQSSSNYYLTGSVKSISGITEGTEKFYRDGFDNYYKMFNYVPEETFTAQYVTITLDTEYGEVNIDVTGKKRDYEIQNLLNSVELGDIIEIPAVCKSKSAVENKELEAIHTWSVLVMD